MAHKAVLAGLVLALCLAACQPAPASPAVSPGAGETLAPTSLPATIQPTPEPTGGRPHYAPGELVEYVAQGGDTVAALAARFNTTVQEVMTANPIIPVDATTLPPGMPMKIPIYYTALWGSAYQIVPDSLFVNGPAQLDFDVAAFVKAHPGWLKGVVEYASGDNRSGAEIVALVAQNFSVSPRLLLALLEYHSQALSQSIRPADSEEYPLDYADWQHKGVYLQLVWAANTLNNGYYGWRTARLSTINLLNGRSERFDPWQNAASVAFHYFYAQYLDEPAYSQAIGPQGLAEVYRNLFGDPWVTPPHLPGSLRQPAFAMPFAPGLPWAFTGGPHTGWGQGDPLSALDFAPPAAASGCTPSREWVTAMAAGVVARTDTGIVVLDLDEGETPADGDERTGWVIFHLHIGSEDRVAAGSRLNVGDPLGHPSCEGGSSTGTHVHLARKYNGEWIPAAGTLAFNFQGWVAANGAEAYQGTLNRFGQVVTACTCSDQASHIKGDEKK